MWTASKLSWPNRRVPSSETYGLRDRPATALGTRKSASEPSGEPSPGSGRPPERPEPYPWSRATRIRKVRVEPPGPCRRHPSFRLPRTPKTQPACPPVGRRARPFCLRIVRSQRCSARPGASEYMVRAARFDPLLHTRGPHPRHRPPRRGFLPAPREREGQTAPWPHSWPRAFDRTRRDHRPADGSSTPDFVARERRHGVSQKSLFLGELDVHRGPRDFVGPAAGISGGLVDALGQQFGELAIANFERCRPRDFGFGEEHETLGTLNVESRARSAWRSSSSVTE